MTSRERVRRAVLFEGPDRVPLDLPPPWGNDFIHCWNFADPGFKPKVETPTRWEDEWGCVWGRLSGDFSKGQVVEHPLTDYSMLDDFKFPDFAEPARYEEIRKLVSGNREGKFVLAGIDFTLMHRVEYLRGHEDGWTDYMVHPREFSRLLDIMADKAIDAVDRLAGIGGVDGMITADDLGSQDRLLIPPKAFREFFIPRYARVYRHARNKGLMTFLHSCGYIIDILPDLHRAGLQVIQMDQQENMGLERLRETAGGKLCFYNPVDIQNTMTRGTAADVRAYARKMIDLLGTFNGGFIAKWYPDPRSAGHVREKIDAMSHEFTQYGARVYADR